MVLECAIQIMSLLKMMSLYCDFSLMNIILTSLLKDQYREAEDEVPRESCGTQLPDMWEKIPK